MRKIDPELILALDEYPILKEYLAGIPKQLWNLLLPGDKAHLGQLASAVKAQRIKQEERNYVMDLQYQYRLSLRPNETVKETMIRARLRQWKKQSGYRDGQSRFNTGGQLPTDPLE